MKYLILLFSILITFQSTAKETLCAPSILNEGFASFSFNLPKDICVKDTDCWISFKNPDDTIIIDTNDNTILNLKDSKYISNERTIIPLQLNQSTSIKIKAFDSNQKNDVPDSLCIAIGPHHELRWENATSWFLNTGITLFSAYFLIVFSIFLFFSLWLRKSALGFSLLAYSVVSSIYLLSFSEYPRAILDPVLASGAYHFPLRLAQDALLLLVFYHFYKYKDAYNIIAKFIYVYALVISIYVLLISIGINDYIYYHRIIIITAPLVAAPMAIGTFFSFKCGDKNEKIILIPSSIILFIFQLNDLLNFWGYIKSYYTVRFYIPFIIGLCLFMYLRRIYIQSRLYEVEKQRTKIIENFVHDVRSPLSVMKVFTNRIATNNEQKIVLRHAIGRIERMLSDIGDPHTNNNEVYSLTSAVKNVLCEKNIEFQDLHLEESLTNEFFSSGNQSKTERIISNLINNAYEAYPSTTAIKNVSISIIPDSNFLILRISDKGCGMSEDIIKKSSLRGMTTKSSGSGIGLSSASDYIKSVGGDTYIYSKNGLGTTIELKLPIANEPHWYLKSLSDDVGTKEIPLTLDHFNRKFIEMKEDTVFNIQFQLTSPDLTSLLNATPEREFKSHILFESNIDTPLRELLQNRNDVVLFKELKTNSNKNIDLVLIDDDRYIRLAWEYHAKDSGQSIKTFPNISKFLESSSDISKNVKVYLDLNIDGEKMWNHIDLIVKSGFKNVFLATGEDLDASDLPDSIIGVSGKLPPIQ